MIVNNVSVYGVHVKGFTIDALEITRYAQLFAVAGNVD